MKYSMLVILFFSIVTHSVAQDIFGLEELKIKSNDFTEEVMSEGQTLNDKLPTNLVPNQIADFKLQGQDSLTMVRINVRFIKYYDYLLNYQKQKGITTDNLSSIFVQSANDSPNNLNCFKDWYATEAHTVSITLTCYQSDIATIKESCIARSIHATIINNANVAECFKAIEKK